MDVLWEDGQRDGKVDFCDVTYTSHIPYEIRSDTATEVFPAMYVFVPAIVGKKLGVSEDWTEEKQSKYSLHSIVATKR